MTIVAALVSVLLGASPTCSSVSPTGVRPGTTASLTFRGERLADAVDLVLDDASMRLVSIDATEAGKVDATIEVLPTCATGLYPVRVRTATGLSNMCVLSVAPYPLVGEVEPNDTIETATPIEVGVTVTGVALLEDADCFRVDLAEAGRLTVELEGMRLGAAFDPSFVVFDASGFEVTSSDDDPLLRQDPCASVMLDAGVYTILVRESAYRGNGGCRYRLHVSGDA
ncbi:MAG: hypothetical protein KDA28_05685, partial [Phycisphaerales bacterium]|nr:hypothetical protein [Phycisphaerales bacterium]